MTSRDFTVSALVRIASACRSCLSPMALLLFAVKIRTVKFLWEGRSD
jgi:hypothetical protein